jgi:hypothetical protein
MYLDDWPVRFGSLVHVLATPQWVQGPWNTTNAQPAEARTFHFHGLRLMRDGAVLLSETYPIFKETHDLLYAPYLRDLAQAQVLLDQAGVARRAQLDRALWTQRLRVIAKAAKLALRGVPPRWTMKFSTLR